jgi:hypothetical protein
LSTTIFGCVFGGLHYIKIGWPDWGTIPIRPSNRIKPTTNQTSMKRPPFIKTEGVNPESSEIAFVRQLQRFRELFFGQCMNTPLGPTIAPPKTVLSFAEDLMLCPTEEAALVRMQRDREAARGCYIIAGDVASAACVGRALILIPVGQNETPFCLLGAVVLLRTQTAIEKSGDHWLGPEFQALGY